MKDAYKTIFLVLLIPIIIGCIIGKSLVGYILTGFGIVGIAIVDVIVYYEWFMEWRVGRRVVE